MTDIWFTSDTHFSHEKMIKVEAKARPFNSIEEMDEVLIERWNSVVKPGDKIYHLGDVFFGDKERFKKLWPRLNGRKRLIVGNHDDVKFLASGAFFQKISSDKKFSEHGIYLSHVPAHPESLFSWRANRWLTNVHGHTHSKGSPAGNYFSVCVELHNLTPIHLEEVKKFMPKN